jgi:amidohydrolase family protein
VHRAIGFDRGVIVHSAIYGSEHRLLLHALESLDDQDRYRGIGIVDDSGFRSRARLLGGMDRPVIRWLIDMLKQDNWWMMISNRNRDSHIEAGWDDAIPYGRAFIEAAPERMIWGSDWPHPQWTKRMMNDAEEVELLYRSVDGDTTLLRKILVDNPARLHGFKD